MKISAYIPCYNNEPTLAQAIASIRQQTVPVAEFFVIDDGSTDGSRRIAEGLGVRVIRHEQNLGRGAGRARAMMEARHDLVLSCDAANALGFDFLSHALKWFSEAKMAAVYGRMNQLPSHSVVDRWRGRHLFKINLATKLPAQRGASLALGGAVLRKSAVLGAGNFNAQLRHSEDRELGDRLLRSGWEVVFDPEMEVTAVASSSLGQVLERYWRWYAGVKGEVTWKGYFKMVTYSITVMARQDLSASDPLSVPISLLCPHYQFWRSVRNKISETGKPAVGVR